MHKTIGLVLLMVTVFASAAHSEEIRTGGLIQSQYVDEGDADSQFLVRAARFRVGAPVTDRVTGALQVDFARDPVILDATLRFALCEYANLSVGQFKIPFGYEFQMTRFHLEAIERSLIMKAAFGNGISNPYVRDVGAMLDGRFEFLNYQLAVVNGTGYDYRGEDGVSQGVFPSWNADNNNSKDIVGRIGVGVPMFAGLGFSVYEGSWECDEDRSAMGFYIHLDTGKVLFQYEYLRGEGYAGDEAWMAEKYGGYYIVVGYRVTPLIQPTFKVDKLDPDRDEGGDNLTDFYYGLNLNFQRSARLQVFYRDSELDGDFTGKGWRAQVSALY